jgi:hypothetical protein
MRIASSIVAWVLCSGSAIPVVCSSQTAKTARYGDTPIVHEWIKLYRCPASATRLPPIQVWPAKDFDRAEACAVAWRARAGWIKSANLAGSEIDPSDSLALTQIVVHHSHALVVPENGTEKDAKPATGFLVQMFRGAVKMSVVVGFNRNGDVLEIGWGHPGPFPPRR